MRTHQQSRPSRARRQCGHSPGTVRGLTPTLLLFLVPHNHVLGLSPVLRPNHALRTDDNGTSEPERTVQGWSRLPIPPHRQQPPPTIPVTITALSPGTARSDWYLTYRIIHHLCGDSSQKRIQLVLKLDAHGLYVEEVVARVLGGRQYGFGPFQCLVPPRSDRALRVEGLNGGQVL